jgi:CRISPR-associated protein Cas5t
MNALWLRLRARFAAFRWLQAGVYRATSPIIPPSAAWGLLLNLAHIETRDLALTAKRGSPVTFTRDDAPRLCLAIGAVQPAERAVVYQQLHSYPVGQSGKEFAPRTHGAKYWIAPVRRELLVDFDALVGVRGADPALLRRITDGLAGRLDAPRYGLPFAGDNNFLFDRIDVLEAPCTAQWYTPVDPADRGRVGSCRLTVAIDRADASRTRSVLFAATEPTDMPPDDAWVWCPAPPATTAD